MASLGQLLVPMLECMAERGPDSAGLAIYGASAPMGLRKVSLYAKQAGFVWSALEERIERHFGEAPSLVSVDNHAQLTSAIDPQRLRAWLAETEPSVVVSSVGSKLELFKDQGNPRAIARKYRVSELTGTHAIGHTRMATESAVSPAHAHPFTAGEDFALVHNGSLSNPHMLRRKLEALGMHFDTDNDSEAVCRYLEWRMSQGDDLDAAIAHGFRELDGFYTLLIATADRMTLVRDPVACKPAVVAESSAYVAVASEFRSLASLPGIEHARIFEPLPEQVYSWQI